jgi:two-component sensor histidine kinase
MGELMFRLLESVIALARPGTEIAISCSLEGGQGAVGISWRDGPAQEHSPFSRPELGLLIARAGWEHAGATWKQESAYGLHSCSIHIAAISGASSHQPLA